MVLPSDLRISYTHTRHDYAGKQWDLLPPFAGAATVAGTMSLCHDLVCELTARLDKLACEPNIHVEHIENAVNESRSHILRRRIDWQLRRELQITLHQLQTGKTRSGRPLSTETVRRGHGIISNIPFEAQLIIAGYFGPTDDRRGIWLRADRKEHLQSTTSPGFYGIGSGAQYALDHLNWRRQNVDRRLPSSIAACVRGAKKGDKGPLCWRADGLCDSSKKWAG